MVQYHMIVFSICCAMYVEGLNVIIIHFKVFSILIG